MNLSLRQTLLPLALTLFPAGAAAQTAPDTHAEGPTATPPPPQTTGEAGTPHPMTAPQSGTNTGGNFTGATWNLEMSSFLRGTGGAAFTFSPAGAHLTSASEITSTLCLSRTRPANFTLFGNVDGRGVVVCGEYGDNFTGNQRAGAVAGIRLMALLDEAVTVDMSLEGGVLMQGFSPNGGYAGALVNAGASVGRLFHARLLNPFYGELHIPITIQVQDSPNGVAASLVFGLGLGLGLRF
ncbi:MAG: hypothetical protein IPJ69_12820 [Deltaproteobacteria bacterium]|nr:MAG: hypothetical protein IPJ69_12820 [Deltaproteobacteria bacterium]